MTNLLKDKSYKTLLAVKEKVTTLMNTADCEDNNKDFSTQNIQFI